MERAVVRLTLFGLLVSFAASQPKKKDRDIYNFYINSTVTSRYATTIITSRVANRMDESKEIEFHVQIPKNAFISKFTMLIDGQVYDGVVKTKEQAQQQYTAAVSRGQSAGIVSSVGRTMEEFKTSVTVAAHKKVTFKLTYEELLKRTHGKYELQIHARPMQPVKNFKVDVYIHEKAGISYIDVKGGLSTKALANAITKTHADKQAWVYFYPTEDQQKTCDSCGEQGMNGDLVIVYDVNRNNGLGDIKTSDGYFVHHFAPSSLPRIPKNVVFVIDQSGSMHGRKMQQTGTALIHILNDLAEDDFFGLLSFNSDIFHWKRELVQATSLNLEGAKKFAQNIIASGAAELEERETNLENIQSNVRQAIAGKFPLYCLGFGFDVNFAFLEKMSLRNSGVARRIYDDSDADLQLKGFYEEVATPLLTDVEMIYVGGTNLTQTNFSQYYNGSEIVVAGEIHNIETFRPQVLAISRKRKVTFVNTHGSVDSLAGSVADGLLQRVWAYLTVKQLLEKELLVSGPEKEKVKSETLELSLKYNFVTPLTSMVVTKPQGENTDVLHKPMEREGAGDVGLSGQAGFPGFHGWSPLSNPIGFPAVPSLNLDQDSDVSFYAVDVPELVNTDGTFETSVLVSHRFLLKTDNQSPPLCFDVNGVVIFKLLHYPSKELYINGELDSVTNGGFTKIVIHVSADQRVEVDTEGINLHQGQSTTHHIGQDPITAGSLTVIRRDKEIDVAVEDVRLVILVHEKDGDKFLWPALRLKPSANNTEGLLALKPAGYQEVQQQSDTKLKIKDREFSVSSSTADDYSIPHPVPIRCWLISADFALERTLNDYFVAQL
ncbi:hypothetical protein CRENBAI_010956 [Crenichthys baileyi]|uniref:VIT domain-containing protein n=1 Tax=Crenichthys baileyi TaxID=28760 RepID=A0AAV9R1G7_9TELE